jgi:hypothetical protein
VRPTAVLRVLIAATVRPAAAYLPQGGLHELLPAGHTPDVPFVSEERWDSIGASAVRPVTLEHEGH